MNETKKEEQPLEDLPMNRLSAEEANAVKGGAGAVKYLQYNFENATVTS